MRKLSIFVLALILVMAGVSVSYAGQKAPAYGNVIMEVGPGDITKPPMHVRRVRYGASGAIDSPLGSGMAVCWDLISKDAMTVSACVPGVALSKPAGILVTDALTQDSGTWDADDNYAWICTRGYCLASLDISGVVIGQPLMLPAAGNGIPIGSLITGSLAATNTLSNDIGTALGTCAADAMGPVILH